jgi:AmmeMemoRadiSam system protein A
MFFLQTEGGQTEQARHRAKALRLDGVFHDHSLDRRFHLFYVVGVSVEMRRGGAFMGNLTETEKKALLKLARSVIISRLEKAENAERPESSSPLLQEKRGCFVTLHKRGLLRGCIGTIEPVNPLIEAVAENAVNAAFKDPRFPPLSEEELPSVDIEISVLTVPEVLEYSDGEDLKSKLKPGVHGVILSKGWHRSTFLPQVWDQLRDTDDFLNHLCRKAGMDGDCWKRGDVVVKTYQAEYFSE